MALPDSFKEDVRRAADLVAYISDYVRLRKVGASWKGLCPFHQEKTPSFNVRGDYFHCFGCGEGGDVFKFAMAYEKLSFPEAVEAVAKRFGVAVPQVRFDPLSDARERKERDEILAVMEAASEHFTKTLWSAPGSRAREYLLKRGFKKETLQKIGAGAARDSWDDLIQALGGRFSPKALLAAGLVVGKQDGQGHYDRFRNRAVFPILNEGGRVVAFGARSLDGSEPKYLNSPETLVYQKSRVLYGLSWARDHIRSRDQIVLMEGYLDVARALEHGIGEAVATCGTALTPQHARFIHRFASRVVLNFDQDPAGQKAARRSIETLLDAGVSAHVVELPAGHDPDSYIEAEGADAYRKRLDEAPPAMEWLIRRGLEENDARTPAGKAAFVGGILPALARVDNAVERSAWVAQIASRGGLDSAATEQELRRMASSIASRAPEREERAEPLAPKVTPSRPELWLLALILQGVEGSVEALTHLGDAEIAALPTAEALRAVRALAASDAPLTVDAILGRISSPGVQRLVRETAVDPPRTGDATAEGCVRELLDRTLKSRMSEIQKRLPGASGEALDRLLREKTEIMQQIAKL